MEKKKVYNSILIIVGTFLLAMSVEFFIIPFDILSGGVAGIAVALSPFTNIDETLFANILTIGLFILGRIFLGKEFAINTALSSLLYPVFTFLLSRFEIELSIDMTLASFYAGLLGGVGIGLVMRTGASTGGMDVPPLVLNKITGIKISTLVMITDGLTVLLGIIGYNISAALIGLVSVFASAWAIARVLEAGGGMNAKSVQIISDHYEKILDEIDKRLERGATLLEAKGAYQNEEKKVVLCVVSTKQYNELVSIIREIDEKAFVITTDASDMHGEGFTYSSPNI